MDHTISGKVHRLWVNDVQLGEIGISAGTAGRYGVSIALVVSDAAGCAEAAALLPGVQTAVVKEGFGRFMGKCLHPDQTADLIEEAARRAVRGAGAVKPWSPELPLTVRMELKGEEQADYVGRLAGMKRVDGYTVECGSRDYMEAQRAISLMITMAGVGSSSEE
jgi:D-amino peptidase